MGHKRVTQDKIKVRKRVPRHGLTHTFEDRKAKVKRGHIKHKGKII